MKTAVGQELAAEILRHYCLSLHELVPLPRGTVNSNYRVDTDCGPLFLQVCEGKSSADADFLAALLWHLCSHGVRTPPLWRTRTGAAYVKLKALSFKPVMLWRWVEGIEHSDATIGEAEARYVGRQLARLHQGTANFSIRRTGIYTLPHISRRIARLRACERAQADLGPLLQELPAEAARLMQARRSDLPTGVGHTDLFPDNLLFPRRLKKRDDNPPGEEQGGWILDLEQAATAPYVYDLAVSLLAFCAPLPVQAEEAKKPDAAAERLGPLLPVPARALLGGYLAQRQLEEVEWQGLYEELRYAALRFTVTRLTDVHGYGALHFTAPAAPIVKAKDYRDFLWRWRALQALDANTLMSGLR